MTVIILIFKMVIVGQVTNSKLLCHCNHSGITKLSPYRSICRGMFIPVTFTRSRAGLAARHYAAMRALINAGASFVLSPHILFISTARSSFFQFITSFFLSLWKLHGCNNTNSDARPLSFYHSLWVDVEISQDFDFIAFLSWFIVTLITALNLLQTGCFP